MKRAWFFIVCIKILLFYSFSNTVFALDNLKTKASGEKFEEHNIINYAEGFPLIRGPFYVGSQWSKEIVLDSFFPEKIFYFRAKVEALEKTGATGNRFPVFRVRAVIPTKTCLHFDVVVLPGQIAAQMRDKLGAACVIDTREWVYWYNPLHKTIVKSITRILSSVQLRDFVSNAPLP